MYHFIVNPNSKSGLGKHIWDEIVPIIKEHGCAYDVYFTKFQKHATKITAKLTSDGNCHTIVVLGGDGTMNEVVNGISDYSRVTVGYVPTGSSNDFARSLGLYTNPVKAMNAILHPTHYQYIDIGTLEFGNKRKSFAVSSGIGFDAAVCHEAVVSKLKMILNRLKLGKLTYAGIAFHQIAICRPRGMTITLDDQKPMYFKSTYFAAVMNNRYEGGGFEFCPDARPDDGLLNLIVIADISKFKILVLLPAAFIGKHIHFKGVHTYTCKKVDIASDTPLPVHTDGEPVYLQQHIAATCTKTSLCVITKGGNS